MIWRKSSYSGTEANCVEIAWRKSTYSATETNCVEIAFVPTAVAVRDSKNVDGPTLAVEPGAFAAFLGSLRS
ncbi:MAG TPA: DUF397 domain-containing protein [Pseudonocardiaceae bacterium]|jgi:hypothetical protein|nr:DUF397 domain-containing protein [Pseudonocardiaceae bacterium]